MFSAGHTRIVHAESTPAVLFRKAAATKYWNKAPHWYVRAHCEQPILEKAFGFSLVGDPIVSYFAAVQTKAAAAQDFDLGPSLGADLWNKTYYPRKHDTVAVHKPWFIIDAEGQTLGRLAVLAATVLR